VFRLFNLIRYVDLLVFEKTSELGIVAITSGVESNMVAMSGVVFAAIRIDEWFD
jgi:hypothetical protein